jgi:hypothetical protein
MTAEEQAGHAVERPAEPAKLPGIDTPAGHASGGHTPETDPQTDAESAAPGDAQEPEQDIERSREQLGAMAEELTARTEGKARARDKAAEPSGRVKSKTGHARKETAARAASARNQLAGKAAAAREKAMVVGGAGKGQLQSRVAAVGAPVWEATPEQVRRAVAQGASGARQRRAPLAVAAGALIFGSLALRWWRKR